MKQIFDVIIVGNGLVGTSLACSLAGSGLNIAILEHHLPEVKTETSQDARPLTLAYGSTVILNTLGIWPQLCNDAFPITTVHVSEAGRFGGLRFHAEDYSVPALGYVVSFDALQQELYTQVSTGNKVTFISYESAIACSRDKDHSHISIKTREGEVELEASLIVCADGARSPCRDLLNIPVCAVDHQEQALIAELTFKGEHDGVAYERFVREGVLAVLPLKEKVRARLVWTLSAKQMLEVNEWSDVELLSFVKKRFGARLARVCAITRKQQFPLHTTIAEFQTRPGFVLMGNAAHAIYPLAAQGFNLGLRDVAGLSELIAESIEAGESIGDPKFLERYVLERHDDQQRIYRVTEGLSHWFGLSLPLAGKIRGLGLASVDLTPPLKRRVAKQLMGISGALPRLSRGLPLFEKRA